MNRDSLGRRLLDLLNQRITIMVIGGVEKRPWRWQFTGGFLLFAAASWAGLVVWAGYLVQDRVDYWVTKADDRLLRVKLDKLLSDMERSQAMLDNASVTDREMRAYLALRRAPENGADGVGGPTAQDLHALRAAIASPAAAINQASWTRDIERLREESERRLASFQEISWYLTNRLTLERATPDHWPVEGRITSFFGYRFSPIRRYGEPWNGEFHPGIDIANRPDTLIRSAADGTVRFAGWSAGYGEVVVIDHGYGYSTLYGHTSKALVRTGERVRRGQPIAYMGTTGRSTGAHLHFEIWKWGKPTNPLKTLKIHGKGRPSGAESEG
jgi:murein DD-endopeptidase MepM/ murein hydrolase activator NlpD